MNWHLREYGKWVLQLWQLLVTASLCIVSLSWATLGCASAEAIARLGGWLQVLGTAGGLWGVVEVVRFFPGVRTVVGVRAWWHRRPQRDVTAALSGASASFSAGSAVATTRRNVDVATATAEQRLEALEYNLHEIDRELAGHVRRTDEQFVAYRDRLVSSENASKASVAELNAMIEAVHTSGIATATAGVYVIVFGTVLGTESVFVASCPMTALCLGLIWLLGSGGAVLYAFDRRGPRV